VDGNHAQLPGEEQREKPLLINPASQNNDDDPAKHLFVDPVTGIMGYNTERGRMCIEIFGLNKRDQLRMQRVSAINNIVAILVKMQEALIDPNKGLAIVLKYVEELIDIMNGKEFCTMAAITKLEERGFSLKHLLDFKHQLEKALN
jgi:hypothetical protein